MTRPRALAAFASILAALAVLYGVQSFMSSPAGESGGGAPTASAYISETGSMEASADPDYWLNSGALALRTGNAVRTFEGELGTGSQWRAAYARSNPADTDGGAHPQNIFRLFTKRMGHDGASVAYVMITRAILSESPNRNGSNGIFIMLRAKDSDNLYYAGLRVDGSAVIKKKANGAYSTLAQAPVISSQHYERTANPNLLPENVLIGLKASAVNVGGGSVELSLSVDIGGKGSWDEKLRVVDRGTPDSPAHVSPGHGGFRSDFMEAVVYAFSIEEKL